MEIRHYVLSNVWAAETVEGITCVWLGLPGNTATFAAVERALNELVAEGFLERYALISGPSIYRRRHQVDEDLSPHN